MELNKTVDFIIKKHNIVSNMVTENHIRTVLTELKIVLDNEIEGDIVELGCNVGTTSIFIQSMLQEYKSDKKFYVYDSFQGLPCTTEKDNIKTERPFKQGDCLTSKDVFIKNFMENCVSLPIINEGWFKDCNYPDKIAFAFFDGDFYSSIMDSFVMVYPKLSQSAILTIHDYDWVALEGVKAACDDYLFHEIESGTIVNIDNVGIMTKL